MELGLTILVLGLIAIVSHEVGHYLAAHLLGMRPTKIHWELPPWVSWTRGDKPEWMVRAVAIAGFGLEGIVGLLVTFYSDKAALCYFGIYVGHIIAYAFTAWGKETNDFKYLA